PGKGSAAGSFVAGRSAPLDAAASALAGGTDGSSSPKPNSALPAAPGGAGISQSGTDADGFVTPAVSAERGPPQTADSDAAVCGSPSGCASAASSRPLRGGRSGSSESGEGAGVAGTAVWMACSRAASPPSDQGMSRAGGGAERASPKSVPSGGIRGARRGGLTTPSSGSNGVGGGV